MTFDEFFKDHRLSGEERNALVRFLALMRYEKTIAALKAQEDTSDTDQGGKLC